jgi:probable F420-dependent oxidoreductase
MLADDRRDARARGLTVRVGVGLPRGPGTAGELWTLVDALEEIGYDSLWLSDTATQPGLAPLATLAAVGARTQRLKLGTSVLTLPPRNPVLLARELATVDLISGGRLLPAGGLGVDVPVEREALGLARGELVSRLEESIEVIRRLWTGEPVTFTGRFCRLTDVTLHPTPTRSKLELWLGGRAPAALRRIGRIADGWLGSFVGPEEFAAATDTIRAAAAEAGRTIDEDHYGTTVFCAATPEDAAAAGYPDRLRALRRDAPVQDTFAVGPDAARGLLDRFVAAGASKFVAVPIARDLPAWLRALFDEVVGPVEARLEAHRPRADASRFETGATHPNARQLGTP